MDIYKYKDFTTTRGQTYHYYVSVAQERKPTLLLVHGFPSTSYDWRYQVTYFEARGYGLIVPDLLGYGGTTKPTDGEPYRASLMARDLMEILDTEGLDKVIAVGHDWCVTSCMCIDLSPS
jgi:soluble epoxide hydrolase/lipid-phosphate phosphatase